MRLRRRVRVYREKTRRLLVRRGHHVVFGISLGALLALGVWWSLFMTRAVGNEHLFRKQLLVVRAAMAATGMGRHPGPVSVGPIGDTGLEVVPLRDPLPADAHPVSNGAPFAVRPLPAKLGEIDAKYRRQVVMVVGEGALLGLLVLAGCAMLYRIIRLEKRAALEKREFWGRITHEIKTPITGLRAFLETLASQPMSREEMLPLVRLALRQVDRQQQLAENLMTGLRLETGGSAVRPEAVDVAAFVSDFISGHSSKLSGVRTEWDGGSSQCPLAWADPQALHVIFDNLADNALKYAGDRATVRVRLEWDADTVRVSMTDDGPGLPPGSAENIFDAYRRLGGELPRGVHGTGMGLNISRKLARSMGGDLTASSPGPGQGATFTVEMPVAGSRVSGAGNRESAPEPRFPIPGSRFPNPDSRFPAPDSRTPAPDSRLLGGKR